MANPVQTHEGQKKKESPARKPPQAQPAMEGLTENEEVSRLALASSPGLGLPNANEDNLGKFSQFQAAQQVRLAAQVGQLGGNRLLARKAAAGAARSARGKAQIQRHPEGAALTDDPAQVSTEIQTPPPLQADSAAAGGGNAAAADTGAAGAAGGGATNTAAQNTGAANTGAQNTAPTNTAAQNTGAASTGAQNTAPTNTAAQNTGAGATNTNTADTGQANTSAAVDTTPAPAPATPQAMDLTTAQRHLQTAFGGVHTIVPGNIVLLADQPATWDKYDEVNLGRRNPHTGQPWKKTDAKTYIPGLQGFADAGTVYVNKQTPLTTATAHEILHNNTAAGFRAAVGETINEGSTEYLAKKALTTAGVPLGAAVAYPTQVSIVTKLITLVGENTLISAYFNGAATLIRAYETIQGGALFSALKTAAEALNTTTTDLLLTPPSLQTKIALINSLLDGWVSDTDLNDIELICKSIDSSGMATVRTAISPRIGDLIDIGQRTRLRVILGA